jgi:hypothetical protein
LIAFVAANLTQTAWLWLRSRTAERAVSERDRAFTALPVSPASAD